jgi:hypothetical protein
VSAKPDPNDPTTWPVADAVPTDIFLGTFTEDCTQRLTEEQKAWPVADAVPTDVFLGTFTENCTPAVESAPPPASPAPSQQPAPPSRP